MERRRPALRSSLGYLFPKTRLMDVAWMQPVVMSRSGICEVTELFSLIDDR